MEKKKLAAEPVKTKIIPIKMDATFFFERAVRSLDRLHYDKALKYFRRAVEYEPENPVNHCNLAGILSEMGSYKDSNDILNHILETVDPSMTECHFYMANNYANMEDFEAAEQAIVRYLEQDANGQFLEESEEMIELLSYELDRPTPLKFVKCQESLFEHDKARKLLEEGRFVEAIRLLQRMIKKHPDFLAARNNLALAYYYIGQFDKAMEAIDDVLATEPGNLHALCNMAIFYQHMGEKEKLDGMADLLKKLYPFHQDHLFKLATTMGILGDHETAYRQFRRMLGGMEAVEEASLYHFTAVAAFNVGLTDEARRYWKKAEKLDPESDIPRFYLNQLDSGEDIPAPLSYHYHLPFEVQFRMIEKSKEAMPDYLKRDPLVRSSFFWALRHGDADTKRHVMQAFALIADSEVKDALREFLLSPDESDELKRFALFVLRSMGTEGGIELQRDGRTETVGHSPLAPHLPEWQEEWQEVLDLTLLHTQKRYDLVQQHDMETLWVEYLTRVFPDVPKIGKASAWSAALEYWTAKMHRRAISLNEVARRYGTSAGTVGRNAKWIDQACRIKDKMAALHGKWPAIEPRGQE